MSEKRRDNRGRILRNGEIQMADGRYRYKYVDAFGETKYTYSWKLDENDRMPNGRKTEPSLREKDKQIEADIFDHIVPEGGGLTVTALVEKYISLKAGVRPTTDAGYKTVINILKKEEFGKKRIDKVRITDAKAWLIQLQKNGRGFSTIRTIRGVLRPAFQIAVDDDMIRKNPFGFELATVIYNDSVTREALTREQERRFMKFVKEDSHFRKYYDGIYILFNTGLRISEFVGLTMKNLDFKAMKINVDHQLQRYNGIGYKVVEPKTESGTRQVPMTPEVAECFRNAIKSRPKPKVEPIIDGYSGFLWLDKDGNPMVAMHWEKYFQHICRHTYCSRMAAARMNPKTLQYIMGHSDIGVTLNTYTHLGFEEASEEVRRLAGNE
ncbi:MAG: site-specific integrase [Acetatifactor sp.]|nr:site-specific integrase [Acetatifactor sp.]